MQSKIFPFLLAVLCATSFSHLQAQSADGKKREIGIGFGGINFDGFTAFNAFYKKELKENVYRRIGFAVGDLGFQSVNDRNFVNFNAGFSIGREKRKTLDRKLQFYRGPVFSVNTSLIAGDLIDSRVNVNLGAGLVFGLQHSFNDLWAINLETTPSVNARFSVSDSGNNDSFGIGVGVTSNVVLGIVRKF